MTPGNIRPFTASLSPYKGRPQLPPGPSLDFMHIVGGSVIITNSTMRGASREWTGLSVFVPDTKGFERTQGHQAVRSLDEFLQEQLVCLSDI